ncbi:MAG: bifunctional D-glycero-beta-D-manno-heptose-7-phosphate kinase/D-glycero-beta-D-manno-heptose 1-phosphate adenylyltransferase HldE [Gammaproteobacteria bacterium]
MSVSVPDFSDLNILVAGDLMLDRYWLGATGRISPEAPVPVVRLEGAEDRPGGAANVAVNVAALGARATLTGLVGRDEAGDALVNRLGERGIDASRVTRGDAPTITKLRVLSRNQQLIRLDTEDLSYPAPASLTADFRQALEGADVVVLSDYAKGALTDCSAMIELARDRGVPVLVDPKGSDFARYRGASVLTPNQGELEAVVGACADDADLVRRAAKLRAELNLGALLVTRSARGMTLIDDKDQPHHLPAAAREVFDVTGAGDTVIAVLATALGASRSLIDAAALANTAAGIVVGKLGVATATRSELRLALHRRGVGGRSAQNAEQMADVVAEAHSRQEKVVMTNGCFDLLHAGHVAYLEEAKQLGDRLIVAVNSDASVRRLKGPERPITPLEDRLAVLAGLAAVDWVVAFDEDTPASLIEKVSPDVLVKGGDYTPDQIAGADHVLANGGDVKVLSFRPGRSTSSIVDAIRGSDVAK